MPLPHLLLALAVVFVWGTNFVVIKWGLAELPPFLFATLRFAASSLPFLLFVRRPAVPLYKLAAFGVLLGAGQFGLLFYAMRADISPGLASLVIQTQVFFTIGLAMLLSGERIRRLQLAALALAVAGMAVIATHLNASVTATGFVLVLLAALSWAAANLVVRSAGRVDALSFMVWSSLFAVPPLVSLSVVFDNPHVALRGLQQAGWLAWSTVAWQAIGNTLFGYAAWNWLLARYPAATVTPMALLVPVFGIGASVLAFGEPLPAWKLVAAGLVIGGLALNVLGSRQPKPPVPAQQAGERP
ncbi:EamA family transporter [Caldimonas tepidiphila]|uniref:EamA family transporter n=1 Tax=Caldimonas tepidiphila TaxID=2315841 RepID=UPI000E5A1829|nr:EamA family transporter [Caldimonas tepidiphila]